MLVAYIVLLDFLTGDPPIGAMFFDIAALRENPSVAGWMKAKKIGFIRPVKDKGLCGLIKGKPVILLNLYSSTAVKVCSR
jgi:hypothetical protein